MSRFRQFLLYAPLLALFIWIPGMVVAAPASAAEPAGSIFGEVLSVLLPLAFIILILLAVLHVARRRYGITGQDAPLSVVQILPVGPRERIVLVRTRGGRTFAVGVSGQSVSLVTELQSADLAAPAAQDSNAQPAAQAATRSTLFGLPLIRRNPGSGRPGSS